MCYKLILAFAFVLLCWPQLACSTEPVLLGGESFSNPSASYQMVASDQKPETQEIFGRKTGYLHPFLSLSEYFTDNLFNTRDNEEDEYTTVISPGIWMALPASRQQLIAENTLNTQPGGLAVSRFSVENEQPYQMYALYRADIEELKNFPEENMVNHRAEGFFQYNFKGGLSVELLDIYDRNHDDYATGTSMELDKFRSNIFNALLRYKISEKLWLRGDYSFYTLNYDDSRNTFRDREDNAYSAYIFYRLQPKTSLFLEYEFIDVNYDKENLASTRNDSEESHYFGGIQWQLTAKSRGRIKVGYGEKNYTNPLIKNRYDGIAEIQLNHAFTPKTSVYFKASRMTRETTIQGPRGVLSHDAYLEYTQNFTRKTYGSATLSYTRDSFDGDLTWGTETGKRKDDYYRAGLAFGWTIQRWLTLSAGYSYIDRQSTFYNFDYSSNVFFLNATAAL